MGDKIRIYKKVDGLYDLVLKENSLYVYHTVATAALCLLKENGVEEVWTSITGSSIAFIGKEIRMQHPGT